MVKSFSQRFMIVASVLLGLPIIANAQDIFIGDGGADLTWRGTQPNAAAGLWLDQGAVSNGDTRRDLIVGSPGPPPPPTPADPAFPAPSTSSSAAPTATAISSSLRRIRSSPVPRPATASDIRQRSGMFFETKARAAPATS
jgi:hypothetical protein